MDCRVSACNKLFPFFRSGISVLFLASSEFFSSFVTLPSKKHRILNVYLRWLMTTSWLFAVSTRDPNVSNTEPK